MGADLAYKVQPVKINYRKKDRQENPDAVLEIAVSSADATLLYYQKDLILERINRIFGERWITGLKFVHIAANTSQAPPPKAKTPLTLSQKNTLSSMLNRVSDPEMREKLEKLGQEVILENIT